MRHAIVRMLFFCDITLFYIIFNLSLHRHVRLMSIPMLILTNTSHGARID